MPSSDVPSPTLPPVTACHRGGAFLLAAPTLGRAGLAKRTASAAAVRNMSVSALWEVRGVWCWRTWFSIGKMNVVVVKNVFLFFRVVFRVPLILSGSLRRS
jgi:hypothetical protein